MAKGNTIMDMYLLLLCFIVVPACSVQVGLEGTYPKLLSFTLGLQVVQ